MLANSSLLFSPHPENSSLSVSIIGNLLNTIQETMVADSSLDSESSSKLFSIRLCYREFIKHGSTKSRSKSGVILRYYLHLSLHSSLTFTRTRSQSRDVEPGRRSADRFDEWRYGRLIHSYSRAILFEWKKARSATRFAFIT